MKSIEDFVLWAIKNGRTHPHDIKLKLFPFGFTNEDVDGGIESLLKQNKIEAIKYRRVKTC